MVGAWCFGWLSGPSGFTCWISFAPVFSFIYCWVLIFALSPFLYLYIFVCVGLYVPCRHLLGKRWPLGSRLWCLAVSLSLSHSYPGSGVVLDCIDSWSLHPYLLCTAKLIFCQIFWPFLYLRAFDMLTYSKNIKFSSQECYTVHKSTVDKI